MTMKRTVLTFSMIFFCWHIGVAQDKAAAVQIAGIVIEVDSLSPVPSASITVKHSSRGAISDQHGYFSLIAHELDTLVFSNVGFRPAVFVVPPNLPENNYGLVQVMIRDTLVLEEVVIYPWSTSEDFVATFLSLTPKNNLQARGLKAQQKLQKTLDKQLAKEQFYYDQMRYSRLYELTGAVPPNNFLNPITWSNFIRDWKNGVFKTERSDIPDF